MPGEKALTPKQAAFARAYLEHGNASLAYKLVYNASNMNEASIGRMAFDVLHNPKVQAEVQKIQQQSLKKASKTIDDFVADLEEAAELAKQSGNAAALVTARMAQAKLLGLVTDRAEVRTGAIDPEEAKPDIAQLWARVGSPAVAQADDDGTRH
jgi:phage terminase small subunit